RAEIVGVAELGAQLLEIIPVALLMLVADVALEIAHHVGNDVIVVDQGVIDVKQENDMFCAHRTDHPPPTMIAIVGPQAKRISRPPTGGLTRRALPDSQSARRPGLARACLFESPMNIGRYSRAQGVRRSGHLSSDSRKTRLIRAISSPELKGLVM